MNKKKKSRSPIFGKTIVQIGGVRMRESAGRVLPPGGFGGPGCRSDANSPRYSTSKSEPVILSDSEA